MSMPVLTEADIRAWVGHRSFDRAWGYAHDGSLFHQRRQGATLKAQCQGTLPQPYSVEATLAPAGIASADCSCPVGDGGYCKHVGALLLRWVEHPAEFAEVESLDAALARRSQPELVALIHQMVARYPDLELLIEMPTAGPDGDVRPLNPDLLRRQVRAALDSPGDDWGAAYAAANQLEGVVRLGADYLQRRDPFNAATAFEATAREILDHYDEFNDEEGEIGEQVNECVRGMASCLDQLSDPGRRETVLRAMFDIYLWDVEYGGIGIGEDVPQILTQQATPAERAIAAEWVRDQLPAGGDRSSDWRRHALGGFLLKLQSEAMDDATFLRICRETGRTHELVARLLAMGRLEEVLGEIRALDDAKLLDMATLVRDAGHADAAERLVRERMPTAQHRDGMLEWLKNLARERGDMAEALELCEMLFWQSPSLARYDELMRLAQQSAGWDALRPQLLGRLAAEQKHTLLTEIHLQAGEVEQALAALPQVVGWGVYSAAPLNIRVAQAAEESHPFEAIPLYVEAARQLIEQQGRENYATAARYLARVRDIYKRLGQPQPWQALIAATREQNKRLRALQDELTKAGL